jgi:hypothetical protein
MTPDEAGEINDKAEHLGVSNMRFARDPIGSLYWYMEHKDTVEAARMVAKLGKTDTAYIVGNPFQEASSRADRIAKALGVSEDEVRRDPYNTLFRNADRISKLTGEDVDDVRTKVVMAFFGAR